MGECALSDPLGNKYCVLECTSDAECDQAGGATCDLVQPPKGVCLYKQKADNGENNVVNEVVYKPEEEAYKSVLQVTCPKSCTNCQCAGCKNITVPLGKCTAAGQGAGVIGSCSGNGKTFTEQIISMPNVKDRLQRAQISTLMLASRPVRRTSIARTSA